jgi:DNA polymerase III subunit epsilon
VSPERSLVFQPSFDDLSTPLFDVTFCVLDLETTGGSPADSEVTEIAAVKVRGGEKVGEFQTLVDPGLAIPPFITVLTGITNAMVTGAPRIDAVLPAFLEFSADSVLVGHNVRFDLSFINAAIERLEYPPLRNPRLDTLALARRLVRDEVRSLNLSTLAKHFRSPVAPTHRAMDDVLATTHVLHCLIERVGTMGVTNLDDLLNLPTAKGSSYYSKIKLTENLPRTPGVYLFRDRDGTALYVGKATDLRSRVRQYFYGDTRRTIGNLMRELESIETIPCSSPLEAEVTELRLIHAHRPRYNRKSRPPKSSHFVKVTGERLPRLSVVRRVAPDGLAYLGPFRSKRSADEVVAALWDATPVRRCATRTGSQTGKCASAQIGVSRCPCDGSIDIDEYAAIVEHLLDGIRTDPGRLLDPLVERMERLSRVQRYEDAAWARDRHETLARTLHTRRLWQSLVAAGHLVLEDAKGRRTIVDHGVLASGDPAPVVAPDDQWPEVPPSVEAAEEAAIIWRWMESSGARIVESTGALALPIHPVRRLKTPPGFAA